MLWQQFFKEKPDFNQIVTPGVTPDPVKMQKMHHEFGIWKTQRFQEQYRQQQANAAAANTGTAGIAARPPVQPVMNPAARLASTYAAATTSLQTKALESQNQALRKLSGHFAFISRPTNNEEKSFLPNVRLTSLAKKAYGDLAVGKLTPDAALGMKSLAADFSKEAISFAIAAARRKRVNKLDPADVAMYLQHTWGIELPGFSVTKAGNGGVVAPYKRLSASDIHKARLAAVRRGNVAQTRLGVGGGAGGAGPSGAAALASPTTGTTGRSGGGGGSKGKGVQKKKITSKAAYAAELAAREKRRSRGESETDEDGDDMDDDDI
jgi:hypothetical protein